MPTSHPNTYQAWSPHLTSSTWPLKHCFTVHEATLHTCAYSISSQWNILEHWAQIPTYSFHRKSKFCWFTKNCLKEDQQQLIHTQTHLKDDINSKIMFSTQWFLVIFSPHFPSLCRLVPSSSEFSFCQKLSLGLKCYSSHSFPWAPVQVCSQGNKELINSYYPPSTPDSKSKTMTSQWMSTIMASVVFSIPHLIICTKLLLLKTLFFSCLQFFYPHILVSFSLN